MKNVNDKELLKSMVSSYFRDTGMIKKVSQKQYDRLVGLIENLPFTASTSYKQKLLIASAVINGFIAGFERE